MSKSVAIAAAPVRYMLLLAAILFIFYGGFSLLFLAGQTSLYFGLMHALAVDAYTRPFLDMAGVLSMGECHRLGFDVLKANPCDPLHRLLNYGPPIVYLPFRAADAPVMGALQGMLLLAAMTLVLRPRTRGELGIACLAALSGSVIYAVERANLDALEFVLIALSGPLSLVAHRRPLSYLLYYVGGVLKFYPFALFLTAARERLKAAIIIAATGGAMIGLYGLVYRRSFAAIGATLPLFEYDKDVFGATCLPFGLADWLDLPPHSGDALMGLLLLGFGFVAWRIARTLRAVLAPAGFDSLNRHYLLTGAIVIAGCFFLRPSITYRGIFLVLLLPGLWELRHHGRLFTIAIIAALLCLWTDFVRDWGAAAINHASDWIAPIRADTVWWDMPALLFFTARELVWWWLIALMTAIIAVFLWDAPATRELRQLRTRR